LYDLAHQFANVIKQILKFQKNKKKGNKNVFTQANRAYEVDTLGRFPELAAVAGKRKRGQKKFPRPPWVSPAATQEEVDSLSEILNVPSGWPPVRAIFRDLGFMKTSETLLLAGDVGAYLMRFTGVDPEYCSLFIDLLRIIERSVFWHGVLFWHLVLFWHCVLF